METHTAFQSIGELDQLREVAQGASLEIAQIKPGVMQGMIAHADLGKSSIHLNRFSLPARGRGSVSADRWTFVVFPLGVEGQFNSHLLNSAKMLAYPPNSEFEGTIFQSFRDYVFTVELDELLQVCHSLSQREVRILAGCIESFRPNAKKLNQIRDFASNVLANLEKTPELLSDKNICRTLHQQLLELLAKALLSSKPDLSKSTGINNAHCHLVRQSEDYLHANLGTTIFVSDLCSHASVSERRLRDAFNSVVGVSPNTYLKIVRLNRVYSQLRQSSPDTSTVKSEAVRWGFHHLGHFARDYKHFFGELPSETLLG